MGLKFSAAESVPWNTVKVFSLWLYLCCSSPNTSMLPQHHGAHLHVLLSAAIPPRASPGPDTALPHAPAPLAQGPLATQTPALQEWGWPGATRACRAGFFPELDRCDQRRKYAAQCLREGTFSLTWAWNTFSLLTELYWLHCYWLLLQYSSKYVQIKESSGAEVQTPNWILGRVLEKFSSDCIFQGLSNAIFMWTLNQPHLLNLCNLDNWTWEGHIPYCFKTHLPLTLLCLSW